ncbi:MAG: flavin reductase family protein, partial [Pyrinomonadaceae bacterium]
VTTDDNAGRIHGITVSAFCSVSLDPPLVLICIEKATVSHYAFAESSRFTVSVLNDTQAHLSEQFAEDRINKFENVDTVPSANGLPAIANASAVLDCQIRFAHDGGDHTIFVGEVESVSVSEHGPLVYFRGNYRKLHP